MALKPRIQADMLNFFEKHILPFVPLQNYVVDLLWRPEADREFEAYVIELNPLAEFAGSGLFRCAPDRSRLTIVTLCLIYILSSDGRMRRTMRCCVVPVHSNSASHLLHSQQGSSS